MVVAWMARSSVRVGAWPRAMLERMGWVDDKPWMIRRSGLIFSRTSWGRWGRIHRGSRVAVTPMGRLSAALASMKVRSPERGEERRKAWCMYWRARLCRLLWRSASCG